MVKFEATSFLSLVPQINKDTWNKIKINLLQYHPLHSLEIRMIFYFLSIIKPSWIILPRWKSPEPYQAGKYFGVLK